ncbi:MAG: SRPBCC family protein [Solirubrobacteraceae bacterium]
MAGTERSVEIPRPPAEVFPWLFEEDKVPQWTTGLEHYERLDSGPLGQGARFRQKLEVSGQHLTVEMEVFEFHPPDSAASSFELRGIDIVMRYALAETGGSTWLTQSVEASGGGIKGRMLIPMIQPYLERKLDADLAALRALLA